MSKAKASGICLAVLLVAVFSGQGCRRKPHSDGVSSEETALMVLQTALDAFNMDVGRYPSTEEGLGALYTRPSSNADGWQGPYLRRPVSKDPLGNDYQYVYPGRHNEEGFDLWSFGRDGKDDTRDDVTNWDEE